ncbi:MAG: S9 family peptidase [Planctomycetes bacterium]|nr:S9 family peptidase [Planctomycetota bacterium]MBI3832848.1 S9 family peptidase [Planctomycetota bacterium]
MGAAARAEDKIAYPSAPKCDQTDDYHGTKVADPFRKLEDPDSPESRGWIDAENKLTFGFLEKIAGRDKIKQRLTEMWDFERYGTPSKHGGRYFFSKNNGLQNQSVMYWTPSLSEEPKLLLDPNTLSSDGTVALSGMDISEDGKLLAYGLSASGSDWQEWRVKDIDSGKDRDDLIKWVKFSGASWTHDGKGFFYSRYDEPRAGEELKGTNYFQKLFYHKLGTPQSDDKLVYERKDEKEWEFSGNVSDDGKYMIITISHGTERKNLIFYKDLQKADGPVVELIKDWEAQFDFVDNDGTTFWFRTDLDAPRSRLIAIDTAKPERANWKEVIPQTADALQGVGAVGGKFFASYLKDARSVIKTYGTDGKPAGEVELPGIGSAGGFGGKMGDKETFYSYTSFTYPATIFRYDVAAGKSSVFKQPKMMIKPDDYETKQVFYNSKDGTKIPMFITHKKGIKLDGNNPTFLYGYGGFDISITPSYSVSNVVWMEMGGVYAIANIRGGGEYGKDWHDGGKKLKKQNCFDDFIAAAEWLIANKYTSTPKLAIGGGSNGGLLVGACITQRPDLYGAALPAVGVMDMLRFHKFTIGWAWTSDYGSADNDEDFKALIKYSPLHNIKPNTKYPATMVTTADHDDRVVPAHSFKFAAALQEANSGPNPTLIRIETKAGHGAGKPTSKIIEESADRWAFLVKTLNMNVDNLVPATADQSGKAKEKTQ